jgi:signal transduction histidine kinase
VRGDSDQLREVFLNLGQNALQAMPNGGALGVEVTRDAGCVQIAVTDCGLGIQEAERETIFLPFVSSKADGLGLGLPIVKRIVEEHGGSVSCQNRAAGGYLRCRFPPSPRRRVKPWNTLLSWPRTMPQPGRA